MGVFKFLKLYKRYQIAQNITCLKQLSTKQSHQQVSVKFAGLREHCRLYS